MLYFTANLSFGSERVMEKYRSQFEAVEEMDEALISNWNSVIGQRDEVIIAGDFSEYSGYRTLSILKRLNGVKHLVTGNRDSFVKDGYFQSKCVFKTIGMVLNTRCDELHRWFYVSHYPMLSWTGFDTGTIHIHGHLRTHGVGGEGKEALTDFEQGVIYLKRAYDVGADAHKLRPVSAEQVISDVKVGRCTVISQGQFIPADGGLK